MKEKISTNIRLACMFLMLYTAYSKLNDHHRFYNGLSKVQLLHGYALPVSWLVPLSEILVFILLLLPQTIKTGLYAFISLMTLFTIYIGSAMTWEPHLPCHCGGAIEKLSWGQHLAFNLAFIALAIIALRLTKTNVNH